MLKSLLFIAICIFAYTGIAAQESPKEGPRELAVQNMVLRPITRDKVIIGRDNLKRRQFIQRDLKTLNRNQMHMQKRMFTQRNRMMIQRKQQIQRQNAQRKRIQQNRSNRRR